MNRFKRTFSFATLLFFIFSTVYPYSALADNETTWYVDGTIANGTTSLQASYADPKKQPPPACNAVSQGDPVYLHSGEMRYECVDLMIPGRGMDLEIKHMYQSGLEFNGTYGYNWTINYHFRLKPLLNGNVVILSGLGRSDEYVNNGGTYTPPAGYFEDLIQNVNGTWTITKSHGEKWNFDIYGNLSSIVDRNNNTILFKYEDASGGTIGTPELFPINGTSPYSQTPNQSIVVGYDYRLKQIIDTNNRVINFNYYPMPDGRLQSIVDNIPGGGTRTVAFSYDLNTQDLLTITKPATPQYPMGLVKTFTYDNHKMRTIRDEKNQLFVTNHYDAQNRVFRQDLGSGSILFNYNVANQTTVTDRNTNVVRYDFNASGNVARKEEFTRGLRVGDPPSFVTIYSYNSQTLMTSVKYPRGNGIKYTYDENNPSPRARGNLLEVRRKTDMAQPDNNTNDIVTTMTYESQFNQIKTVTDPRGQVTTFVYDYELPPADPRYNTKGNLTDIYFPSIPAGNPAAHFAYNANGQPVLMQDPNGILTSLNYYPATGYLQSIARDPAGINAVTAFTYDNFGYLDQLTDAENHTTNYDFNELGWLIQEKSPLALLTLYSYDKNGNVETITRNFNADTDATDNNQTTQFTYTILNKLQTVRDPLYRLTTFNYDNNENLTSVVDAENKTTAYQYDERDLLFKILDANTPQGTTKYDYDINGILNRITDANTNATNYVNDLFDRQQTITYADTKYTDFVYDKNSNLTQVTQGQPTAPKVIQYAYDNLNNLIAKRFPATPALDITYGYDLGSRLTLVRHTTTTNPLSIINLGYDNLNRATTVIQTLGALNPLTMTYQYDRVSNRKQVVYPLGKVVDYTYDAKDQMDLVKVNTVTVADYTWDLLNRRQQLDHMTSPVTRTSYSFDIADQLAQVNNQLIGSANPVSRFDYFVYDNVGNRKTMGVKRGANPVQNHTYTYNAIYELTGVSGAQTHTFQYDNVANRTNVDGVVYQPNNLNQYSVIGAQAYLYDASGNLTNDRTNAYTYDEENRLTGVTNANATYQYDGFNRRISKTVNGVTTYFISDSDREIEERDATGALLADYVYGDSIDEVLTMTRAGSTYHYLYDGLGSVTDILNSSGTVVESYNYDVYGQPSTLSTIGNPFYFTGRRLDIESGIYDYRNRTYNQHIGRFHQRDLIGYFDSMNLTQYVRNSPTNYTDSYGLAAETVSDYATWQISLLYFSIQPSFVTGASLLYDSIALGVPFLPGGGGYLQTVGKVLGAASKSADKVCKINTPFGAASQYGSAASKAATEAVNQGVKLFRGGKLGKSAAAEGQFWALGSPLGKGFVQKYGVPSKNVPFEFIIGGSKKAGQPFITRNAPTVGTNKGGGIEVVTNPGGVQLNFFYMP